MDSLFEDMLSTGDQDWMGLNGLGGMWTPVVEIKETDQELFLKTKQPYFLLHLPS